MFRLFTITTLALVFSSIIFGQLKERADKFKVLFEQAELKNEGEFHPDLLKKQLSTVLDSSHYQEWSFGEWQKKQSSLFSYSNDLKDEVSVFRTYDYDKWNPKIRTARKYDDSHNLMWECVEMYKENKWEFVQQKFVTYVNGLVTEELFQSWNNDDWINYTRFTSKYDGNGNETELLTETWVAGQWFNTSRYTSEYDENNNNTLIVAETWDQEWKYQSKYEQTFNDINLLTVTDYYQWENENWKPISRTTNTYNNKNEVLEILSEQWIDKILVNSHTTQNYYDETGTIKNSEVYKRWNFTANDWDNDLRYTYAYNNGSPAGVVMERWIEGKWVNSYKTVIEDLGEQYTTYALVWVEGEWVNSARYMNFYKNLTSVEEPGNLTSFSLEQNFPNPFNPATTITYTLTETQHISLKIFNVLGQLITTLVDEEVSAGTHNINFNAAGLSSGIFYYRLDSNGFSETKAMMLLK